MADLPHFHNTHTVIDYIKDAVGSNTDAPRLGVGTFQLLAALWPRLAR